MKDSFADNDACGRRFLGGETKNLQLALGALVSVALRHGEGKAMRVLAYVGNAGLLLGALALFLSQHGRLDGAAALLFLGLLLAPLFNLITLYTGPDREEMQLKRELNKAEMRAKLKAIGEGKGGCCG